MNEIKCPNCGKVFIVDEFGFANIIKQVRDHEFEKELLERETLIKQDKENAVKLAEVNTKSALQDEVAKRDAEIAELKAKDRYPCKSLLAIRKYGAKSVQDYWTISECLSCCCEETEKQIRNIIAVAQIAKDDFNTWIPTFSSSSSIDSILS